MYGVLKIAGVIEIRQWQISVGPDPLAGRVQLENLPLSNFNNTRNFQNTIHLSPL